MPRPIACWWWSRHRRVMTPTTQVQLFHVIGELKTRRANRPGARGDRGDPCAGAARASDAVRRRRPRSSRRCATRSSARRGWRSASCCRRRSASCCITCANVANLLLSRSAARRKEIALRMSVGSGPLRVVRQLLAESLAYAAARRPRRRHPGVLAGQAVVGLIGSAVPRLTETTLDIRVMAVAMAISIGTALLFGVGPAIALCFTNVQEVLKDGGEACRRRDASC